MQEWIDFSRELAEASGNLIMNYFGTRLRVDRKSDQSPVTEADQGAESLMREMIGQRFPDHQVVGEEAGRSGRQDSPYQWLLDPIDGTQSFIHGVPLFGTLIALLEEGRPILGVIHLPVSREMLVGARGQATTLNGTPVQVSTTTDLAKATVLYTGMNDLFRHGHGKALQNILEEANLVRGWGDCYGHFMVATGRADIMIDPVLNAWDVAALRPCVEGAGGCMTDLQGRTLDLGESAVSTNGLLHDSVISRLRQESP